MKKLYVLQHVCLSFLLLLFFFPVSLFAQRTLTARSNTRVTQFCNGFYESLPANYATSGKKYPLLVFLHGLGEVGDGSPANLPKVLRNGPPRQIDQQVNQHINANFPDPVVVNGQSFEFIVISPQLNGWPGYNDEQKAINDIISYSISHYRVDTAKMYLTGLSMGGGIAWEYAGYEAQPMGRRLAGLLVIAGASWPAPTRAAAIAKWHVPVWATHNDADPQVPVYYTNDYVQHMIDDGANPAPLKTIFSSNQHDAWSATYGSPGKPGITNNGMNVYQWMLQYTRVGDNVTKGMTPPVSVFTVNAGPDITINLPVNSTKLMGSVLAQGQTLASCRWKQYIGPSTAAITNGTTLTPTVSNLIPGEYVFRVDVLSTTGATSFDGMKVTVKGGTITVNAGPDITIMLPVNSAKLMGSANTTGQTISSVQWRQYIGPSTASFTNGNTLTPTVSNLIPGEYVFRVDIASTSGATSFDGMKVTVKAATAAAAGKEAGLDTGADFDPASPGALLRLYPNPAAPGQQVGIEGRGWSPGKLRFTLYDIDGKLVRQIVLDNRSASFRQTIPTTGLTAGTYTVSVSTTTGRTRTFKLLVR